MRFLQLLKNKEQNNNENKAATIAFFGDSVTQGCFEIYKTGEKSFRTLFDNEEGYIYKVKKILSTLYPDAPVNVINGGLNGTSTALAVTRIDRDILNYKPDLVVICFGLNDCHWGVDRIGEFVNNLEIIFKRILETGAEIIYMTPNMMNTKVNDRMSDPHFISMAETVMKLENDGVLEKFEEGAKELCKKYNVPVCDCYAKWKKMAEMGVDTSRLLCNDINHPSRDMHWLFAHSLIETMFEK